MMRSFFRNHRAAAYISLTLLLTVVCTVGFFTWQHMDVFGKFKAEEPYVKDDAVVSPVTVTSEGSNQKGKMGSGAKPLSKEIPTCEGMKGSKSNPFVVLEVVPDKAQQQLIYLGQDEGGTYPLDIMKIGIELAKEQGKTYADSSSPMDSDKLKSMGQWFSNYSYDVYKIGSDTQKEKLPFAYIDKLYTLTISDEEIAAKTGDEDAPERFAEIFKETTEFAARKWHDIEKLSEQFPDLFVKDSKGKEIRDIALSDPHNWEAEWKEGVTAEEESETYASGFIITVEPGEGDFGFANQEDCNNWVFTKTGTEADRFVYVKDEEELEEKYPGYLDDYEKKGALYQRNVWYGNNRGSLEDLYKLQESEELTGLMLKINNMSCKYIISPEIKENHYTFKYFGVTNNNILKRALFTFKDEKDYEGFHMEIRCMTPAELNKLCKSDTEETVDMIERADMYFIQSGSLDGSTVNETEMLEDMYYEHVAPNETKSSENITFYENDLEWSLCQKIIQRQSQVQTLPLMFNQMVGRLLELGISRNKDEMETHMYVTAGKEGVSESRLTDVRAKGSRNNLSKLYLISVQFDLLARKDNPYEIEYDRTFMEDIYPNIKTVSLPKEDGVVDGTATTTGYYDGTVANPRRLCSCELPSDPEEAKKMQKIKERAYYLWNTYTFFPVDMEENFNGNLPDDLKEKLVEKGYQDTFFDTNDGNAFSGSSSPSHQSGSDGNDEKNVTIVSDLSNSNTNHSSILGNKGDSGGIASKMLDILYTILNNQTDTIQPVTVTAEEHRKIYVKLADDAVMLDYEEDGKIRADRQLYLKVRIWNNENNRPGQVKSIELMNDKNGNTVTKRLYTDKTFTTECAYWKNPETEEVMEGQYAVSPDDAYLEGYVPFRLNEWKRGFTTIRFKTVGWINNRKYKGPGDKKNPKQLSGEVHKTDISLIGKTLFDLE